MSCELVDWRIVGASKASEVAHRTPPAGTEINPRYDKVSFLNKI